MEVAAQLTLAGERAPVVEVEALAIIQVFARRRFPGRDGDDLGIDGLRTQPAFGRVADPRASDGGATVLEREA